jgi:NADH:ubiquinone oxidoreductase subunit 6 (subunit J)
MVISAQNPVHSVLFFFFVFLNGSGLLLLIEAEYNFCGLIVVYVGAIAVLFLFVVMMLDIKITESVQDIYRYIPFGSFIGLIFFLEIFLVLNNNLPTGVSKEILQVTYLDWRSLIDSITNLESLGQILYTYFFIYFLLAGLILLVAMIGAIVLTMQLNRQVRRQVIFKQVARNFNNAIFLTSLKKRV